MKKLKLFLTCKMCSPLLSDIYFFFFCIINVEVKENFMGIMFTRKVRNYYYSVLKSFNNRIFIGEFLFIRGYPPW
jgi:hypothetical protein